MVSLYKAVSMIHHLVFCAKPHWDRLISHRKRDGIILRQKSYLVVSFRLGGFFLKSRLTSRISRMEGFPLETL